MMVLSGQRLVLLFLLAVSATSAMKPPFLDCPGNLPPWHKKLVRRCCADPRLPKGCECFSIESDSGYRNTAFSKPKCPDDLGVQFFLYTRSVDAPTDIQAHDGSLATSNFHAGKPVKVITHGFTSEAPNDWSIKVKDAILDVEDANVILVNWKEGAKVTVKPYYSAVANVRTVGAMLAKMTTVMMDLNLIHSYGDVHLIGHSLGAHVSGVAGKEVHRLSGQKIGRISGLDPAGPMFESYGSYIPMNSTDADFVDVIHTNGKTGGFGIRLNCGTVDFWPNGGGIQPGCDDHNEEGLTVFIVNDLTMICDHTIVTDYFVDSIRPAVCTNSLPAGGCRMGYYATPEACSGAYDGFSTSADAPYCVLDN